MLNKELNKFVSQIEETGTVELGRLHNDIHVHNEIATFVDNFVSHSRNMHEDRLFSGLSLIRSYMTAGMRLIC